MYKFLSLELILLIGLVLSYLDWRKAKTALKSYFVWLCFAGMAELLCQEGLVVVARSLPENTAQWITYWPNLIFWIAAVIVSLFFTIKSLKKDPNKAEGAKADTTYLILMILFVTALITASVYFWMSIYK